jgi:lambda repressor-like predicted transcriptional regulator
MLSVSACEVKRLVHQDMPNTIGERIREALRRRRWEMTELSEQAAIPYRTLQNWIKKEAIPTDGAVTIARTLSVSVVWLVTGEGSMEATLTTNLVARRVRCFLFWP